VKPPRGGRKITSHFICIPKLSKNAVNLTT
jgi:hypothetical protein